MVYQYSFGDKYQKNEELKQLQKAKIKNYQDTYIDESLAQKTTSIKTGYPTLASGVISSLVVADASAENIKKTVIEQEKINAQNNKDFATTPNEVYQMAGTAMIGKAFGLVGQGIKSGTDEFMGGVKRLLRFSLQSWETLAEETISRTLRTNIMMTGELEQELQNQGLTEKESARIGKVYNALGFTPLVQADRRAVTNAIGKIIARNDFGVPDKFNESMIMKMRQEAGGSSLEQVLNIISNEQNLDTNQFLGSFKNIPDIYKRLGVKGVSEAYDRLTGTGFLDAGIAREQSIKLKEANLYNDRNITQGRYVSDAVLGIQNERIDFWVSGILDAAILMVTDPANLLGKTNKALQTANKTLDKIKKAQKAGNLENATEFASQIMREDTSKEVIDLIIQYDGPDKFIKLVQANKDPIFALKLFDSNVADDVYKASEEAVLTGTNWNGPSFNGTKIIPDWLNNKTYKALRKKQAEDPQSVIGSFLPQLDVNLENATETLEALINYGTLAKVETKVLNDTAVDLTRALQKNEYGKAQKILLKDFYGSLIKQYSKNNKTSQSYNLWADKKIASFRGQNIAYTVGEGPATRAIKRIGTAGGKEQIFDIPLPYQTGQRTFQFTDYREVKRIVNTIDQTLSRPIKKIGRYTEETFGVGTPLGQMSKSMDNFISDLDLRMPKKFEQTVDKTWDYQMAWSTAMLPTRAAYPFKLVGEGTLRAYLYGFDTPLNSIGTYSEYLLSVPEDITGKAFKTSKWSNRQLQEYLEKAVGNSKTKISGPQAQKNVFTENFDKVTYTDEALFLGENSADNMNRIVESLRIQYSGMWQDDITKDLADYMVNNKSMRELAERFWNGDKQKQWQDYIISLDADVVPTNVDEVLQELTAYQSHIISLSGGNKELLESFSTGVYKNINMRSYDRRLTENLAVVKKGIKEMIETSGEKRPIDVPTPRKLSEARSYEDFLEEMGQSGFNTWQDALWYWAGSVEANAIRIPYYKQLYYRSIAADFLIADEKALGIIVKRMDTLPKAIKKELLELHPELKKSTKELSSLVAKNNLEKISIEAIDARAQISAFNESTRIFYNLSQKGQVADSLRFVFPFLEAFKEVGFSLLKGARQKPDAITKTSHAIQTGRRDGIVYKDPLTQDDYVAVPMPNWVANRWLGGGADKLNAYITVPLSGFNLIGATLLPGIGPVMGVAIGAFSGTFKKMFGRDTYKLIVPYGTPIEDIEELGPDGIPTLLGNIFVPGYLKSILSGTQIALTGELKSMLQEDSIAGRALDSAKIVALNETKSLQTEEEFANFDQQVIDMTMSRLFIEGILKGISPSPTRLLFETEFDIEGKDVQEQFKPLVENVLDGMDLGKVKTEDAKKYVSLGILSLFYSELQKDMVDEYGVTDGEFFAWLTFSRMTGIKSLADIENLTSAAILKEGKYKSSAGKLPRTKQELSFKDANPDVVNKYQETYLYLMDDIHEKGDLENTLFFEQLKKDDIVAIDPALFLIESQEFLYDVCYEQATKLYRNDNSVEARNAKNKVAIFCEESFPLGTGETEINYQKLLNREVKEEKTLASRWATKMNELEDMAKDTSLSSYPVHNSLQKYFINRDVALFALSTESETLTYPENKLKLEKQLRTGRSDVAQQKREELRQLANILVSENPEFYIVYDEVLSFEIQYNKNYEFGE